AVTVATRWFNHRRGLVMGLFAASNATGQLVFLPLIAQITTAYGWRIALVCVCCMLAFAGIVAFTLMRDRPSDLGLPLYGESAVSPPPAAGVGLVSLLMSPLLVLKEAARAPIFWVLFGAALTRALFDAYLPAFLVAGALCIVAALAILPVRKSSGAIIASAAPAA